MTSLSPLSSLLVDSLVLGRIWRDKEAIAGAAGVRGEAVVSSCKCGVRNDTQGSTLPPLAVCASIELRHLQSALVM